MYIQSTGPYSPSEVFEKLQESLATPPDITTLRVKTNRHMIEDAVEIITEILCKVRNNIVQ